MIENMLCGKTAQEIQVMNHNDYNDFVSLVALDMRNAGYADWISDRESAHNIIIQFLADIII